MDEGFTVDGISELAGIVFDSGRARIIFEADVFWARASIGEEALQTWLDTYQIGRNYQRRGIVELEFL